MIYSMTGYGRSEVNDGNHKITVELKSVNHKYLDANFRLPRKFNIFENEIRNLLKQFASRGKVDIFISYEDLSESSSSLKYNKTLAKEYYDYYRQIQEDLDIHDEIYSSLIAKSPDVLVLEEKEQNEEEIFSLLKKACEEAFNNFREERRIEGEALKDNILTKLDEMNSHVGFIEGFFPELIENYKQKLIDKVKDLLESSLIDDSRIAAEVTLYADKTAIDEELVRLKTHISHMQEILCTGGDVGRNLDFLAQEMNRESNTILSKSNSIDITNRGIELKTCIEKIREQVQNIQ